jgi:hypothetical protein
MIEQGMRAFTDFYSDLFSRWGISKNARRQWTPYLVAWAQYVRAYNQGTIYDDATHLPPLSNGCYLDHLLLAQELRKAGKLLDVETSKSNLQGLVLVVALTETGANRVADYIAAKVGGARRVKGIDKNMRSVLISACNKGEGCVCSIVLDETTKKQHDSLKSYEKFISIVFCDCSDESIRSSFPDEATLPDAPLASERRGKLLSSLKKWKVTKCARSIELSSDNSVLDLDVAAMETDETMLALFLSQIQQPLVTDERPGILVFFPSIPGSGKSSCVAGLQEQLRDVLSGRRLIVQEGDKTKEDFWSQARRTRQCDYGSVYITDKNTPAATWSNVGDICAATKALAVPVVPDSLALRTTRLIGFRTMDGSFVDHVEHVYPFSLHFLAVCIARVIGRVAGSHAGKLDQSTPRAGLIVVGFFALYRSIRAEDFVDTLVKELSQTGALVFPTPIKVPVFSDPGMVNAFPADLEDVLVEALRCHVSIELFGMVSKSERVILTVSCFRIKVWLRPREQVPIES